MGTLVRLSIVVAFLAAAATVGVKARVPTPALLLYLGGLVGFLIVVTAVANYAKKRELEAGRELRDPQRLHKPNELLISAFLRYLQWGLVAVAALGIAKGFLVDRQVHGGFLVLVAFAVGAKYFDNRLHEGIGEWSSMRVRLMALAHRSVELVILADPALGTEPIEVQAQYSRSRRYGDTKHSRTELLWRSPPTSAAPRRLQDRTEFRVRIAMPDDFQQELEMDEEAWRRSWHVTVKVTPTRYFNFDFDVPRSQAPTRPA